MEDLNGPTLIPPGVQALVDRDTVTIEWTYFLCLCERIKVVTELTFCVDPFSVLVHEQHNKIHANIVSKCLPQNQTQFMSYKLY